MRVFVTGATGLVGSAVVAELIGHGHSVLALARSDASALAAKTAGAEPLRGSLADLDVLRAGAAEADGVIHLAFAHDLSSNDALTKAIAQDSAALATLGDALIDSGPPGHRLRFCDREGGRPCHRRDRWGAGAAGDQFALDEMGYLPLAQSVRRPETVPSGQQALRAHLSDHHHQPGLRSPLGAANGDLWTSILAYRLQNKAKGTRLVPVLDDEMAHRTRLERVASTFGGQP
jgi:hypothetical protein